MIGARMTCSFLAVAWLAVGGCKDSGEADSSPDEESLSGSSNGGGAGEDASTAGGAADSVSQGGVGTELPSQPEGGEGVGTGASGEWSGNASSLVVMDDFSCALSDAGRVACWGAPPAALPLSELGPLDRTRLPEVVPELENVKAIYASESRLVAWLEDGSAVFFGPEFEGGIAPPSVVGQLPELPSGTVELAISADHGLALTDAGQVWYWGEGKYAFGLTGPLEEQVARVPELSPITGARAVAASPWYSAGCAILEDGTVTCWGRASLTGNLNDGTPRVIAGIDDAKAITVGGGHACALRAEGKVSCWGNNDFGQLGSGKVEETVWRSGQVSRGPSFIPSATIVDVVGLAEVAEITAGKNDTCAVLTSGEALCWGENSKDGNQLVVPYQDYSFFRADPVPSPLPVQGLPQVSYARIGEDHGCAIAATKLIWCWGEKYKVGTPIATQTSVPPAPIHSP